MAPPTHPHFTTPDSNYLTDPDRRRDAEPTAAPCAEAPPPFPEREESRRRRQKVPSARLLEEPENT